MAEPDRTYLLKAMEARDGAATAFLARRYNNCANRAYYACFAAAVYTLERAGFHSTGAQTTWSHSALQATFNRELITRRKVYPAELREILPRTYKLREAADYSRRFVSSREASRVLQQSQQFIAAVQDGGRLS